MTQHLWQINHPYYCSESNYYKGDVGNSYESWQDFESEWSGDDLDLNFVFRWDWKIYCGDQITDDTDGMGLRCAHDDYYRCGSLSLFYVLQRKGIFLCNEIRVCRADEPDVRSFLQPRWEQMQTLWMPVSDTTFDARGPGIEPE